MSHKKLPLIRFVVLLSLLSVAHSGFAQAPNPPLNFGNNFFVTGDYVVAGAQGMTTTFSGGYAVGTIKVPDANPGITGVKQVPAGAQIIDALLYWETVEKTGVAPGQPGSGQNGFFRSVIANGPSAPGYPISGVNVSGNNTVSWSSGGCTGTSTGKIVRAYRADVLGYLPQDANGNVLVNGTFEVRLPSVGNASTPLTLGATLVVIYRVVSTIAPVPLNSIVIYEGTFAPTNASLNMTQTIQGFYQAGIDQPGKGLVSRLTHIVGNGKSNKYQTVHLDNQALPSLYGNAMPAFPGYYGTWDNPTWTLPSPNLSNPVQPNGAAATTEVIPSPSNQGCVAWGAVIVGTTVQDSAQDGLLDVWKNNQGYTDVGTGQFVSLADIPLPANAPDPPKTSQQDVFIQLDYVTEPSGASFLPNMQALQMVHDAFKAHNVHLHFTGFNAIGEGACTDGGGQPTCPYPNQPGITTWRAGLEFVKNYLVPLPAFPGADCTQTPQNCTPRFPPAQKDSYHYVVFGDAVGGASWSLADGSLSSVVASGNTVTFTTSAAFPTGMPVNTHEGVCPNGRVTISDAITNPSLNGTYCVQSFDSNHFTISSPVTKANYTHSTDPNLAVSTGEATSRSGTSDLGGAGSLITLGLWGADGQSTTVQAGTLMHELGHTFYLPHGGAYYDNPATPYVPTFEANCKPNYQSVMSYLFQVDLLDIFDPQNKTLLQGGHLDFSGQTLTTLQESSLNNVAALQTNSIPLQPPTYAGTKWYAPGPQVGTPATRFCDGTPFAVNQPPFPMYRLDGLASSISPAWTINQNIDFGPDTTPATTLRGFNDWASLDLRQIGATGSAYVLGGAFPRGGGAFPRGGGAFPTGGGAFPSGGGAFPRGGGAFPRGGGASGDITHETANSVTRSPRNLTATEAQSPRTVTLNWTPPTFGQISTYNVYRSKDGGQTFQMIAQVSGNPPATTYPDTTLVCTNSPTDYQYFVTAVLANTLQESVPSNIVPAGDPITGCYTLSGYSSPAPNASAPAGNVVPITFEVQDDFYAKGGVVSSLGPHNTLRAIGPIPHDGSCSTLAQPPAVQNFVGTYPYSVTTLSAGGAGLTFAANRFTYNWNTATSLGAGCYFFELDLDSNQFEQSGAFTLLIFESGPTITTTTLPNGIVGSTYNSTLTELGGIPPLTWSVSSGGLPLGINLNSSTGALSGTPSAPGIFNYTVQVTDSKGNFSTLGTPQLSITVASSGQPASSLSVLVNGPAKTAVAYVAKGSWNAGNGGPGGGPGISVVNIEGNSVTNAAVPTALDIVNSCASNALTGATVCTADDNVVYILNGTTVSGMVTSGATGLGGIAFQGGQCTTCGVVMDSVHNQALIAVTDNAPTGGFQFLNLNTVLPALGTVFQSEAVSNTPANISPSVLLDPTRSTANPSGNTSYGSGAIVLSAGESGNFEIVDVTNPASPGFFENMPPGLGLAFHLPPGSSGEDTSTGIALAPIETTNPSQVYIADLTQASFTSGTPGSWSTMASQVQLLTESMNLSASGAGGIAVAQGNTHTGVITGDVGGNAITAILLPSTSGGGTPAITDWVTCTIPAPPSNVLFAMGYDPHTMTAYQSPTSNDAIVVIADQSGPNNGPGYLAVLDLTMMLNTTTVPRTAGGHGCASGALPASVVNFIAVP